MSAILAAARAYIDAGMHPIRVHGVRADLSCTCGSNHAKSPKSIGKHPTTEGWAGAALDAAGLLRELQAYPESNLGLRMGLQPSGLALVALDVDDPEEAKLLEAELGGLPETWTSASGRGFHLLFSVPVDSLARMTSFTRKSGIDLRAEGTHVVSPPSRHYSGTEYRFAAMRPPAALPAAWLEWILINSKPKVRDAVEVECPLVRDDRWLDRARDHLRNMPVATPGDGVKLMNAAAVLMRGHLLTRATADALLRAEWNIRCPVPWDLDSKDDARNWEHRLDDAETKSQIEWGSCRPIVGLGSYADHPDDVKAAARVAFQVVERADSVDVPAPAAPPIRSADMWLEEMNRRHVVLTAIGGKCKVMSWVKTDLGEMPALSSFDDFKNRYMATYVPLEGVEKPIQLGGWWLRHPQRAEAESFCMQPGGGPRVGGRLNLWRGYAVQPREGEWPLMRAFLRDVIAAGDATHLEYIWKWCAWVMQHPGERAETVLVLRGKKGTGKNTLFDQLCIMLGIHALTVTSPRHLTGNFNAHLHHCALLFANEAVPPADKAAEAVLKGLVTDATLAIERKGVDVEQSRNRLSVGMASNDYWCVPAGLDERRFAVFDVSDCRKQDQVYFGALHEELNNGGREAMLHALLTEPLGKWHPRSKPPQTKALTEQQTDSLRGAERDVHQMLSSGVNIGALGVDVGAPPFEGWVFCATGAALKALGRKANEATRFALALQAACPEGERPTRVRVREGFALKQLRGIWLPPLAEARKQWCLTTGLNPDWGDASEWSDG